MHTEYNLDILEAIFGSKFTDVEFLKKQLRTNSSNLLAELETYRIFDEEETEVIDIIEKNYRKYSKIIIDYWSKCRFDMPIEVVIATQDQSRIKAEFMNIAEKCRFDSGLQAQIDSDLEEIANKLNKRFSFDESSLIHLIEASKASNIQLEECFYRKSSKNKRQILRQKADGTYYFADVTDNKGTDTYTSGKSIPTVDITRVDGRIMTKTIADAGNNIDLSSYPGAKDLIGKESTSSIMQQVMRNLFDNLELCVEMYKFFYTKDHNIPLENSVAIQNTAVLADDSQFDFYYKINRWNLPHLLGIQNGLILSEATKRFFAEVKPDGTIYYPIDENSSAFQILKVIIKNKDRIIEHGGLIEENGKTYQLFPWEKIILKTSSFMRGDFFKTCFCLVQLDHGLNASNERFTSISSTKYNEGFVDNSLNVRKVLKDLINTTKQKKDFIFRTFIEDYDKNTNNFLGYIPQSIDTGKSETIVTSSGERVETLNRFRNAFDRDSDGGTVVQSIENELMGKRYFTPIEQTLTHIDVASNLGVNLQVSEQAYIFEENLRQMLDAELDKDLLELLSPVLRKKK